MLPGCTPWPTDVARRYRELGLWRGETLHGLVSARAAERPERIALIHRDRRIDYAELERLTAGVAGLLRARGITAGDRVVVQLPNVPEFVVVCLALYRVGAVPVFALAAHRFREIGHLCTITGAVGYVFPATHRGFDHAALAERVRAQSPELRELIRLDELAAPVTDGAPAPDGDPGPGADDVAFFLMSGGTTALPKLIPRTHDDYAYQLRASAEVIGLDGEDVYLAALPLEFNFTWGCPGVLGTLVAGGTVVLADDPTADDCFAAVAEHGVTVTSVVPTVAQLWLETLEWSDADLSSLRLLQIGGAKLAPAVAARVPEAFGCRLQQVFGMAEGLLAMSRAGDPPEAVRTTQGRPISELDEVRIADEGGDPVPAGEIGELLARGPYTLRGYYRAAEHNHRAFTADGFYRTGDLARLTPAGDLVIEGRIKDVVIKAGDKVSAGEVEEHLVAHPGIREAAVIGEPDELLGELVCAVLVTANGERPALAELKRALHEQGLADYKLPDRVRFRDSLPLTALGKVDKKVLRAELDAAAERVS